MVLPASYCNQKCKGDAITYNIYHDVLEVKVFILEYSNISNISKKINQFNAKKKINFKNLMMCFQQVKKNI